MLKRLHLVLAALVVVTGCLSGCGKSSSNAPPNSSPNKPAMPNLSTSAHAVSTKDAEAAYQRHDYATALKIWLPLAHAGNADAQVSMGTLYEYGQGVPSDYTEALRWYHKAADQNNAAARRAIGFMYESGNGVAQDYAAAFAWYSRAARQGDPPAQMLLGGMYGKGESVPQNYLLAHMWLSLAASSSDSISAAAAKFRDNVSAYLTKEDLLKAQVMARTCQQSNYTKCDEIKGSEAPAGANAIPMQNVGGVYMIPVMINDALSINFILDSGASDVSIPADVVMTLVRTGTLSESDFVGTRTYTLADGSTAPSDTIRIRSLKVGSLVLENVLASLGDVRSTPLLGQSFLGRFKSWSIDNGQHALVLNPEDSGIPTATPETAAATTRPAEASSTSEGSPESVQLDVAKQFYDALAHGDGQAASNLVIPEKRASGPFSAARLTQYYSNLQQPLRLDREDVSPGLGVGVHYSYVKPNGATCTAGAIVSFDTRNGPQAPLIAGIRIVNGSC